MEPQTLDQFKQMVAERDLMLLMLFGILAVVAFFVATELALLERFLREKPEVARMFAEWRRHKPDKPPNPHVCPTHGLLILPGRRCWVAGCDWRSPPRERKP